MGHDHFELLRPLDRKDGVQLFQARDRRNGRLLTFKAWSGVPESCDAAVKTVLAKLERLAHPAVAHCVASGRSDRGELFMAYEWLEGESLDACLAVKPLPVAEACALVLRVVGALDAAARVGVSHGNLSLGNLFLESKQVVQAKLLDFAIPRALIARQLLDRSGSLVLDLRGMSPEQARGEIESDERCDVFALGWLLYQCLTGAAPFEAPNQVALLSKICLEEPAPVESRLPSVPRALATLLQAMLSKAPAARPDYRIISHALTQLAAEVGSAGATELKPIPLVPRGLADPRLSRGSLRPWGQQRVLCAAFVGGLSGAKATRALEEQANRVLKDGRAKCERLLDGSLIVTADDKLAASEQAVAVARSALAIRKLLSTPIAVCTGRVVIEGELPYGDLIDRGAAMLAAGEPGVVALDDASAALLDTRFETERGGGRRLLLRERAEGEAPRTLLGEVTPFVGRERELMRLQLHMRDTVKDSEATFVLITGPAGSGKSRLGYEFVRRLERQDEPFTLFAARGDLMRTGTRFGLLAPALRSLAGFLQQDTLEQKREKLLSFLRRTLSPERALSVAEILGDVVGAPFPEEGSSQLRAVRLDPQLMADRMLASWLEWLEAECQAKPVLMLLEDLHWADPASVRFVEAALRNLSQRPLFVVGFARPEVSDVHPKLLQDRALAELRLTKLSPKACEKLLAGVVGLELAPVARTRLIERADGNPFFLEELVRAYKDGGAIPESVLGIIQARLDALGEELKALVRAASIFGHTFSVEGVGALLGALTARHETSSQIRRLVDHELVFAQQSSGQTEYVFRHALIRDAAYLLLPEEERRVGHRLAAEWLEAHGSAEPAVLADHYERGGASARAAECYRAAAAQALEASSLEHVVRFGERAVRCGAEAELLGEVASLVAEAHSFQGEDEQTLTWAQRARECLPRGAAAWWRAMQVLAIGNLRRNSPAAMDVIAEMSRQAAAHAIPPYQVTALAYVASAAFQHSQRAAGMEALNPLAWGNETPEQLRGKPEGCVLMARTVLELLDGNLTAALEHGGASLTAFRSAGAIRELADMLYIAGSVLFELGAHAEATRHFEELAVLGHRLEVKRWVATAALCLGIIQVRNGQNAEAEARLRGAAAGWAELKLPPTEATARTYLALALCSSGDPSGASEQLTLALALSENDPPARAGTLAALARLELTRGNAQSALEAADAAMHLIRKHQLFEDVGRARLVHVQSLLACGKALEAQAAMKQACDWLSERADKISEPGLRSAFLSQIPEHAKLLALREAWPS